jgi:hypothetical protein
LKIIRGGTYCYTIAMCAQAGHEDAMATIRDTTPEKLWRLAETIKRLKGSRSDEVAVASAAGNGAGHIKK